MEQPEGFTKKENEHLVCKLKKSIYSLKQAPRQWYIKFNNIITSFGFKENIVDQCIYLKVSGSKFIFLILYVDDILLANSDRGRVKKQSITASSTMEAEFVACFEASSHALWLRNFVSGLGVVDSIAKPLRIYCDNTATVFFSKNGKFSSGSKHMDLKYLVVKERVQKQQVSTENIRTTLMVADPLTKGLPPKAYLEHIMRMGLLSNP